jgi:hypothetical protein
MHGNHTASIASAGRDIVSVMVVLLILAVGLYAIFIVLVSRAAGKIDDGLSGFIFNGLGALLPLGAFLLMKSSHGKGMLPTTKNGVLFSVLAGISIGLSRWFS